MAQSTSALDKQKQRQRAEAFRQLHVRKSPLVLYNVWDAGSAKAVAKAGAKAIATSSWSVAKSHGFEDGEQIPLELVIQNLRRIVKVVDLPVTVDLESGYGDEPDQVGRCIQQVIDAGAIGCNLEDSFPSDGAIRVINDQVERIRSARRIADSSGIPFFINARCDVFYQGDEVPHDEKLLAEAIERVQAYADAGADGFFVPGLVMTSLITELAERSPIPVNILVDSHPSIEKVAKSGASRVSFGATPYAKILRELERSASTSGK